MNKKEIYLDNAATTKTSDKVMERIIEMCTVNYGNPSSMHNKGLQAENYMRWSAQIIANAFLCDEEEIYFTSGGTESNNIAIMGVAKANRNKGKHLVTTNIEHASVRNAFKSLEEEGFDVTYLNVDKEGYVRLEELEKSIRKDTILVSIMYINNEIGTKEPIDKIGHIIKKSNPKTYFHVDAVQAFGKYVINVDKSNIDLMSISGHKVHTPKGIGALYVKKGVKIDSIVFGGGQQRGLRPGTENNAFIVALGETTREIYKNLRHNYEKILEFKTRLVEQIYANIDDVDVNGPSLDEAAPHILSIRFKNIRGEALLHALSDAGIYISTGSACSAKKSDLSRTLLSIGLDEKALKETIRISFSANNDVNDIPYIVGVMKEAVAKIRKAITVK